MDNKDLLISTQNPTQCYMVAWMGGAWGDYGFTVNDDCSHEIKRHLLVGRKAMTQLDSILKSRDITLLTDVRIVKAMVFAAVRYGCDS